MQHSQQMLKVKMLLEDFLIYLCHIEMLMVIFSIIPKINLTD
nr:MAG TPA: hypothetical protein [Caudoviricetes sp.]